jgi:RNA polymerase sigma-70 factor (ECF subfamily)
MSPEPRSIPVETLLADAGWVRRLAARLVADPGTADELAQQTLVAAWRRPPAEGTDPRRWLARVLRNFARQKGRSETARAARERSTARGPVAPDDLLERAELAQRLARHVLELDEPYRTTVLRRFFDGWSAEEIARADGTNPSTVRTRLERALARLRERLEREHGREWMAALLPLARVEPAGVAVAGIAGGIVVGTGTKLALGLCGAALCGWFFWPRAEPIAPALESLVQRTERAPVPLETSSALEQPARAPEPGSTAVTAVHPAAPHVIEPGTIEGVVVRRSGENELPIEGAHVELWPADEEPPQESTPKLPPEASTTSGADGTFRFTKQPPGSYTLRARVGRGPLRDTHAQIVEKVPSVPVKILFGSTRIHGRVHDERGEVLAGIPIRIDGGHEFQFALHAEATSDERGNYAFEELPAGKYFGLVSRDWQAVWPGRMWNLTLFDGDDLELDMGEPRALAHWRGAVRTASGEAVKSGGTLHLERTESFSFGSVVKTYREVLFDATARFDVLLESGPWHPAVSLQSKPETRRTFEPLEIGKDDLEHDLVLPGARLSGTVYDSVTLEPLAGYAGVLQVSVHRASSNYPGALQSVEIDESAHFAIDMLDEGDWVLTVFPLEVAAAGAKLEFTIGPNQTEKQLDVQVQKP